jgi:soluble lytic murein transglycosylase-like protein
MRPGRATIISVLVFALVSLSAVGSTKYDKLVKIASDRYFGLESDYLWHKARIRVESNFNPMAQSQVGAAGLTQFMPSTAFEYGATTLADRFDPTWSIDAMVRYIRRIWDGLGATYEVSDKQMLSDASYNGGPTRVKRLCRTYGYSWVAVNPHLPQESRNYAPLIQSWREKYAGGLAR